MGPKSEGYAAAAQATEGQADIQEFICIGVGQIGRLLSGGALRCGLSVSPVLHDDETMEKVAAVPSSAPTLISVPESVLADVLSRLQPARRDHVILVQNELFFADLLALDVPKATVAVLWTNAKPNQPILSARPTAVFGPHATLVVALHQAIGLQATAVDRVQMAAEMAAKYAVILTMNALGLAQKKTVKAWLQDDPARVQGVAKEAVEIARYLAQASASTPLSSENLLELVEEGLAGFASLPAAGRTAAQRLQRALNLAKENGLVTPLLSKIAATPSVGCTIKSRDLIVPPFFLEV